MEGPAADQDQRFAEWYVWAKREVGTDSRVCLGAAQAALEALDDGADDQAARAAARSSLAGHGVELLGRIPARRRAYAEWYDWARRELGGGRERQHAAAQLAMEELDRGGDAAQAASAARGAGAPGPAPAPAPPPAQPPPLPPTPGPAAEPRPWQAPLPAAPAPAAPSPGPPPAFAGYPPYGIPPPPPSVAPSHAYGGFWRRAGAAAIDLLLLSIGLVVLVVVGGIFALIGLVSSGQDLSDPGINLGIDAALLLIFLVLAWLYYAGLESSAWQGTIGKRVMRLVVTDMYGRRIDFGRATGRYSGKILSMMTVFVGYVMAAFTERKQALHDLMAGTLVVRQQHLRLITTPQRETQQPPAPAAQRV